MSLARLKAWLRGAGLGEGERGLELMRRNRSFVFFRLVEDFDALLGPIAGAGVALTPLRSIAVDRGLWSYGLPFWIEADLPWEGADPTPFRRLMIAQDTGSAIVGPARADIFFGGGDAAGARAGSIRHGGDFTVLLPVGVHCQAAGGAAPSTVLIARRKTGVFRRPMRTVPLPGPASRHWGGQRAGADLLHRDPRAQTRGEEGDHAVARRQTGVPADALWHGGGGEPRHTLAVAGGFRSRLRPGRRFAEGFGGRDRRGPAWAPGRLKSRA